MISPSFKFLVTAQVISLKDTDIPLTAKAAFGDRILEWLCYYRIL